MAAEAAHVPPKTSLAIMSVDRLQFSDRGVERSAILSVESNDDTVS